jgi:hypothetical protein
MRPEEVYRIQPENVRLAENYLFNPYGKTKSGKAAYQAAKIILVRQIEDAANCAAKDETGGAFLFPCVTDATRPVPRSTTRMIVL